MGLLALEYFLIPFSPAFGGFSEVILSVIRAINRYAITPAEICVLAVGLVVWLRDRHLVDGKDLREFGDGFLWAIIIMVLVNIANIFIAALIPDVPNTVSHETLYLAVWAANTLLPVAFAYAALARFAGRALGRASKSGAVKGTNGRQELTDAFCEHFRLTAREREICELLTNGMPNKDICQRLNISHGTVKNHVSNIFGKLKIGSRFELSARIRDFASP